MFVLVDLLFVYLVDSYVYDFVMVSDMSYCVGVYVVKYDVDCVIVGYVYCFDCSFVVVIFELVLFDLFIVLFVIDVVMFVVKVVVGVGMLLFG